MRMIPEVDISAEGAAVVAGIRAAMSEIGFVQMVGHGVPPAVIAAAHATVAWFDRVPPAEREHLVRPHAASRGLIETVVDGVLLRRSLQFTRHDTTEDAEAAGAVRGHPDWFAPNVWPADAGFRAVWQDYRVAVTALGHRLMALFAQALGLSADHFAPSFETDATLFSANWYSPRPAFAPGEDPVLLHAHPDSGVLTLLHQAGGYDGLQVLDRDGGWITVPTRPEAFIINIGVLMTRWTNGSWPATVHRVLAGPDPSLSRSSIAAFFLPNIDEVIAPVPALVGSGVPAYEPISTYDWEQRYMTDYILASL